MEIEVAQVVDEVSRRLQELEDSQQAEKMADYMKTSTPFYGVQAAERDQIVNDLKKEVQPETREEYEELVSALWNQPHREEKYIAVRFARQYGGYICFASLPLYERMVREGAWWDFVDEIAGHLVGRVLEKSPEKCWPRLDNWIEDEHLWIRRAALVAQLRRKEETNRDKLFEYCLSCASESDFFIRKAIGWALRDYGKTEPDAVKKFVETHRDDFSNLTVKEALKHIE